MREKLHILGINGSASENSSNLAILKTIAKNGKADFDLTILDDLTELPPFKTEWTNENTPEKIVDFRYQIAKADGIIICTPEYIFSIPSRLKNAIEWCVSTTDFSDKVVGLITASADGVKAHMELKLIMKTIQTHFNDDTTLLIQGVRGKVNKEGKITDDQTKNNLKGFVQAFNKLINETVSTPAND